MDDHKLGKTPARPDAITLKFSAILEITKLPKPPVKFGHYAVGRQWGVLGNDKYGDCVWAGAAHETMVWTREAGTVAAVFRTVDVLSDYSAQTGFDPSKPDTDQGTDMQEAASYRRRTGILDATGKRHLIDAYADLKPGNLDQIASAAYVMGAVGIGFQLPTSAMDQFDALEPWDVVSNSHIEGGHYVPLIGRNSLGNYLVVTWGRLQAVTPRFIVKFMDEGAVYLSIEPLKNKVSPEGFDEAALQQFLSSLH